MFKTSFFRSRLLYGSVLAILIVGVLIIPSIPIENLPGQDNGVFLYGGQRVLAGDIPYLDFWDHKGPLIYYINALGLFLGSGSRWGVWFIEFAFLFVTIQGLYRIEITNWKWLYSAIVILIWFFGMIRVGSYYHLHDSNYVETYGLAFSVWAVVFWLRTLDQSRLPLKYFFIGVMAGMSFALRPNNIAVLLSVGLVEMFAGVWKGEILEHLKHVGIILIGCFLVLTTILIWFWMHGAVYQLMDSVFTYNIAYSRKNLNTGNVLKVLRSGMEKFYWIPLFAYIGVGLKLAYTLVKSKFAYSPGSLFTIFLLTGSMVEVFLSSISGRVLLHYYISWTPYIGLLVAEFIVSFPPNPIRVKYREWLNPEFGRYISWVFLFLFFVVNFSVILKYTNIANSIVVNHRRLEPEKALIEFIHNTTKPNDKILVWGNDVWINFLTKLASPSIYSYQYPLYMHGYTNNQKVLSFLQELSKCPPVYIVEPIVDTDEALSLRLKNRLSPNPKLDVPDAFYKVFKFIDTNYKFIRDFNGVYIYKWTGLQDGNFNCH
jgi:hypothetical protein